MTDIIGGSPAASPVDGYYGTVESGDSFFANRIGGDPWSNATDANKLKALKHASSLIDQFNYVGSKTDSDQSNEFPRGTATTVPKNIEYAAYLIAEKLLDSQTPEGILRDANVIKRKILDVETTYSGKNVPIHLLLGIPSAEAFSMLKPFLRDPSHFRVLRTI